MSMELYKERRGFKGDAQFYGLRELRLQTKPQVEIELVVNQLHVPQQHEERLTRQIHVVTWYVDDSQLLKVQ